jgi:crotonobetainyl-CoA:carnitine CoA-transferase CaiB-like acyl-CoA transferase
MTEAGPLAGLRLLECCDGLAGQWAGQLLAELGVEVIRLESTDADAHTQSPPSPPSPLYLSANRGKQSLRLNLRRPAGQDLAHRLAARCDMLLEDRSLNVGVSQAFSLNHDALRATHPGLIYGSLSAFGPTGPYAGRAADDAALQALSGMMSFTGHADGEPGAGPLRTGPMLCEINAGLYAAVALLAALRHRDQTGRGQHIELSLLDATLALVSHHSMAYLITGQDAPRAGNGNPYGAPTGLFRCADGLAMLNGAEDYNFVKLAAVLGRPEWVSDPRFATRPERVRHQKELTAAIEECTRPRPRAELLAAVQAQGLPCAPVNDSAAAFAEPQLLHRGMLRELVRGGRVFKFVANPLRFSGVKLPDPTAPPTPGEHTVQAVRRVLAVSGEEAGRMVGGLG